MIHPYRLFFIALLSMLILSMSGMANSASSYNQIVFFGDSLTDNGNLYSADYGLLPKSPPYFQGRFANGPVWSEYVAQYFHTKNATLSDNFAVGGETAVLRNPFDGFLPYALTASLDSYLIRTALYDRSKTLFIVWIGANDYLSVEETDANMQGVEARTAEVVDSIKATIESLIYHGGVSFLVINLPDLSSTPYGLENQKARILRAYTAAHNAKLSQAISSLRDAYKMVNINLYDVNQLFTMLLTHPDEINKKYHLQLSNLTQACWQGGYTLRKNGKALDETQIRQQLEATLKQRSAWRMNGTVAPAKQLTPAALAHAIVTSPALAEAYQVGQSLDEGVQPCRDPEKYVFWDHVHPTAVIHTLLSKDMIAYIEGHYE